MSASLDGTAKARDKTRLMKTLNFYVYILVSFTISFLEATSSPITAQTYVLNPHKSKVESVPSLPLNPADEARWTQSFLKRVPIESANDRQKIKNSDGESLATKIKAASQAYLELRLDDVRTLTDEALALIAQQWPYAKLQSDIQELYALKLMASSDSGSLSTDTLSFASQADFISNLPVKYQTLVTSQNLRSVKVDAALLGGTFERYFIFGKSATPPFVLKTGRWLVYGIQSDEVSAFWISVSPIETAAPTVERLWTRSIWKNIPHSTLKSQLIASKPNHLTSAGITVIVQEAGQDGSPLLISSSPAETASNKELANNPWPEHFSTEISRENESSSIFKSPWFWVIAGTAAGLGGYLAFQSSHGQSASSR